MVSRLRRSISSSSPSRPSGPRRARQHPTQPAQPVRPARRHPQPRGADHGRRPDRAVDDREQVHLRRHPDRAGRAERRHRPGDAGEPERADVGAVAVVADEVPPPVRRHHAPRLHGPPHGRHRRVPAVGERHRLPGLHRRQQRRERRLDRPHAGLDGSAGLVDLHPGRPQLDHRAVRRPGQPGGVPEAGGQRHRGRLVGLEVDLAELVVLAGDAVAVGGVEHGVAPGLQRDAQLAQLGLVAFEHPEERVVGGGVGVAGDRRTDPLGGQELAGRQQAEHEVHQTLGPC